MLAKESRRWWRFLVQHSWSVSKLVRGADITGDSQQWTVVAGGVVVR